MPKPVISITQRNSSVRSNTFLHWLPVGRKNGSQPRNKCSLLPNAGHPVFCAGHSMRDWRLLSKMPCGSCATSTNASCNSAIYPLFRQILYNCGFLYTEEFHGKLVQRCTSAQQRRQDRLQQGQTRHPQQSDHSVH